MAKKIKRVLALAMALTLCIVMFAIPVSAHGHGGGNNRPGGNWGGGNWGGGNSGSGQEWYKVIVQGTEVASGVGDAGNVYWLGRTYTASYSVDNAILTWSIVTHNGDGNVFGGTVDLTTLIEIPEGFGVGDVEIETGSIDGVNNENDQYDNAVITITIKTLKNEETGEEIVVPDPTKTSVTVNHNYYTEDLYTGETVKDGSTSGSSEAIENASYTATPVTDYNGNSYIQTTDASALTITVNAVAAQNVINIDYLRTIDTTPQPVETSVTVIHNYYTNDIYTGETVKDGSASGSYDAIENDAFTATAVTAYGGNTYARTTDASALTITVNADASKNVINIDYVREISTAPVQTTVTVIHIYGTEDVFNWEYNEDGTYTVTEDVTEDDVYTASPIVEFGGNTYEMTTHVNSLTRTIVANDEENVIYIEYLRTIDTSPRKTNVTVVHNYYTEDVYTGETVEDGSGYIINEAKENDEFTATLITEYEGIEYISTTDEDDLTITVDKVSANNIITINYLRTIDTTPAPEPEDYEPVLTMVKSADKVSYEEGEVITWTITVTNTSDYTAYNVNVIDEMTGDNWTIDSLAPGASKSFTATTANAEAGALKNVAVATWEDNDDIPDAEETDEITTISDDVTVTVYEPAPAPQPEPEPEPEPEPAPAPAPQPEPEPEPEPEPAPAPAPAPAPQPEPEPEPEPEVEIEDEPAPAAAPAAAPAPAAGNFLIDIPDEDVPLADVPQTGDISLLWTIISLVSGGGAIALSKKKD